MKRNKPRTEKEHSKRKLKKRRKRKILTRRKTKRVVRGSIKEERGQLIITKEAETTIWKSQVKARKERKNATKLLSQLITFLAMKFPTKTSPKPSNFSKTT